MKKQRFNIIIILKAILLVCSIIAIIIMAIFPFKRQDITLKVCTEKGTIVKEYSADEIISLLQFDEDNNIIKYDDEHLLDISWENIDATEFDEIDIYRGFRSVCIGKIAATSFWEYGTFDEKGIHFNQDGCKLLYDYTNSFLMERLIYAEIILAFSIFLWIVINVIKEKKNPENRDNHGPVYEMINFVKNIIEYRQYIIFAAKADLNAEVANSYLNRLWWILEPFCNMIVYVVVFGNVMGRSVQNYATFIFAALLMWNCFNRTINFSVKCVRNNRDIVTKIYVPKYVLLLTNMTLNFIKLLFSLLVLIVMLIIFRVHVGPAVIWVIPAYLLMLMLSFGVGMILLHYGVFIDDLSYAIGILLNMVMFLSGVFYDVIETLPTPLNGIMMVVNPVAMFIDTMRNALLGNSITNIPIIMIWLILSLLISYIGIHIVNKNENGYVKVI